MIGQRRESSKQNERNEKEGQLERVERYERRVCELASILPLWSTKALSTFKINDVIRLLSVNPFVGVTGPNLEIEGGSSNLLRS